MGNKSSLYSSGEAVSIKCPKVSMRQGGAVLSRVVAGMWRMGDWSLSVNARVRLIEQCIELGVTSFDHADIYGDSTVEALFGEALATNVTLKKQLQIITKCGIKLPTHTGDSTTLKHYNLSNQHIKKSVDNSLQKLGVEKIDLLLIHRPSPLMDFDEMAATFQDIRASGKVLHFGVSNFTQTQFAALNRRFPLSTNQVEFSPLNLNAMNDGLFESLQDLNISPMIWSALGGGALFSGHTAHTQRIYQAFTRAGLSMGLSPAGAVYAWIMRLPCKPLVLTGSGRIQAIAEAVTASNVQMDALQWFELLETIRGHEVA
jgi:predicted oxidoreductase